MGHERAKTAPQSRTRRRAECVAQLGVGARWEQASPSPLPWMGGGRPPEGGVADFGQRRPSDRRPRPIAAARGEYFEYFERVRFGRGKTLCRMCDDSQLCS